MKLSKIISSTSYFVLNKELVKKLGVECTLVLSDLISKEEYFQERNMTDNGFFFNTLDNIKEDTTLSHFKIRNALNKLVKNEFIEIKLKGIPARTYIKIFHIKLLNYLTSCSKNFKDVYNNNKEIKSNIKILDMRKPSLNKEHKVVKNYIGFELTINCKVIYVFIIKLVYQKCTSGYKYYLVIFCNLSICCCMIAFLFGQ